MDKKKRRIYVIGHKNPDTDSICSAIAYAKLKSKLSSDDYMPMRAGSLNEETMYVLHKFGVEKPELLSNVRLQIKDIDMHEIEGIDGEISILQCWKVMKENHINTLPVLETGELKGIITTGDIACSYMDTHDSRSLSEARTQFKNIAETLQGKILVGSGMAHFTNGKIAVGASDQKRMQSFIEKDDLILIGNRENAQFLALNKDVNCIVVCNGCEVSEDVLRRAEEHSTIIISTPLDTFTCARLINQAIPVRYYMTSENLECFRMDDFVHEIKDRITRNKYRDFPVLDRHDRFQGFISRRRLLNSNKKQMILVDHNERSQAVDGIEDAEILEIIDHHRIGGLQTMRPVYFRNQPVGCTATIVYQMYVENQVKIDKKTAGLLCCAIISDTLMFRSPTCTPLDQEVAETLAGIAKINIEKTAMAMFKAGSSTKGKSAKEICFQDFKRFHVNDKTFGIGQISSMSQEELTDIKKKLLPYLDDALAENGLNCVFFMLTDILNERSEILCAGEGAKDMVCTAYDIPHEAGNVLLKGVVSRKKQLVPTLVAALQ